VKNSRSCIFFGGDIAVKKQRIVRGLSTAAAIHKAEIFGLDINHSIYNFFLLIYNP